MSNNEDYNAKIDVINAIDAIDAKPPSLPVDVFLQEAENLFTWCQPDKKQLIHADLDWKLVEDLPTRAGALREAESRWFSQRFTREEARKQWIEQSPKAYDLRDEILHAMRYAYRNHPDLLGRVSEITEGSSHADMIQDLNNIAVLGKDHPEPLKKVHFDLSLLDKAAETADEMADLLAKSSCEDDVSEAKKIRDRAFTHCKEAVDAIRNCGQYVFWKIEERLKGYYSNYNRRIYRRKKKNGNNNDAEVSQ